MKDFCINEFVDLHEKPLFPDFQIGKYIQVKCGITEIYENKHLSSMIQANLYKIIL